MDYKECMEFVNSYSKSGGKITDLSRVGELMERIGNPQKRLRFVHVAGTNGKGSTVEYISKILRLAGYKTGQFTSPFIRRYNDRMRIDDEEIDDETLCSIAEIVKEKAADRPYSQFEITMAVAMLWYVRENCDIVVLETGIGGLLDATNIIPPPLLSVITSISLDHTAILGDTVEEIAVQKAGIIKEGSAVVLADDNAESVKEIVRKTAAEKGAEFVENEKCRFIHMELGFPVFEYEDTTISAGMQGMCQFFNAQAAITACVYLRKKGYNISFMNIYYGIGCTAVPARIQIIKGDPKVIVDGSHNPAGVKELADTLSNLMEHYRKSKGIENVYAVMGMVDSKDYIECIRILAPSFSKIYTVDGFAFNSIHSDILADTINGLGIKRAVACGELAKAVESAKSSAADGRGIVVVCGSLYLASEYLNNFD